MKKLLTLALALVTIGWFSCAAASKNLNSSRSNIYRVMYQQGDVTPAQATAILAELGKGGSGLNEVMVMQALRKVGVSGINKIIILPSNRASTLPTVILLMNPADEQAAREIAVSDSGTVSTPKPPIIIKK